MATCKVLGHIIMLYHLFVAIFVVCIREIRYRVVPMVDMGLTLCRDIIEKVMDVH